MSVENFCLIFFALNKKKQKKKKQVKEMSQNVQQTHTTQALSV